MSEWISTIHGMPEVGDWYLVAANSPMGGRVSTLAFLDGVDDYGLPIWLVHNDADSDEWENVTHWMPLPEPPL